MRMHPSKPSIRKTDLFVSAIGIRITIEAAAGFGGSIWLWEEGGWVSDLREAQEPLLESDLDDGGVDAEKYRPNLVRRRAVAYADGGEDDTTKPYDVGEAVVLVHPSLSSSLPSSRGSGSRCGGRTRRLELEVVEVQVAYDAVQQAVDRERLWVVAVSRDWRKRGSPDDAGTVGTEGDAGDGAPHAPVTTADIVGDVGDCRLILVGGANGAQLCGAGGRGSCIRPSNLMPAGLGPRAPTRPRRRWRPGSPRARRRRRGGCRRP
ncbi:hypothetical protein B0H14DRAFT_2565541 [Mycena olivaceomarginata]|nr:hypothetical protein B0H14DRAFT_2565541 [Mycena olivaceomarginata]